MQKSRLFKENTKFCGFSKHYSGGPKKKKNGVKHSDVSYIFAGAPSATLSISENLNWADLLVLMELSQLKSQAA